MTSIAAQMQRLMHGRDESVATGEFLVQQHISVHLRLTALPGIVVTIAVLASPRKLVATHPPDRAPGVVLEPIRSLLKLRAVLCTELFH
jgi:hypothetical protein